MDSSKFWLQLLVTITVSFLHILEIDAIFATEWPVSRSQFENTDVEFFCEVHEKDTSQHLVWFIDMDNTDTLITLEFANETSSLDLNHGGGQHTITKYEQSGDVYRLTYQITGVKVADEGLYACGFVPLPLPQSISINNVLGNYAVLEVLVPPTDSLPQCDLSSTTESSLSVSSPVTISCGLSGGRPVPQLTWYRNGSPISTGLIENVLTLILAADDNGVEFTCTANGTSLSEDISCSITPLKILPTASITSSSSQTTSGSNVSFSCIGEGIPKVSEIEWFINGLSVDGIEDLDFDIYDNLTEASESSSQLDLFNVDFAHENNIIDCVVEIPSGLSTSASVHIIHSRSTKRSGLLDVPLLPIIAGVSGFLVLLLILFILRFSCIGSKCRGKVSDNNEDIYQPGEPIEAHAHTNPYHETDVDDDFDGIPGYVINELPGHARGQQTMGSDHPYATVQRDAYLSQSP